MQKFRTLISKENRYLEIFISSENQINKEEKLTGADVSDLIN